MNLDFVLTTCPFCGCGCQFYLQVWDGQITGVIPCKTDPVSQGKLCIKGRNAHRFVHHKDRLTTPLIREDGQLRPATWEQALDRVSQRLGEIKARFGPQAVGVIASAKCTNEENFALMKFARAVLGTNNIDHCARLCHASTVVGLTSSFGSGAMTNSIPEIEGADCLLVIGSNTLEQHPVIGARVVRAQEKGAKLIVIDPRRIALAEFADVFLQVRPGTDICLLNGLMNVLLSEDLIDRGFISQRTEGFAEFQEKVKEYTPPRVEKVCGVPAEALQRAARLYGKAERAMIIYCMGLTQHITGTDNVRSCANLALLTGSVGRESTGVNPLRGQNNVQGACDMGALPNVYSGYQPVTDKAVRQKFEQAWGRPLSDSPGLTLTEMFQAAAERQVKALYVVGENPMLSEPSLRHAQEALESLEFLVVQDIFLSETARLAHVVLPAACFAEKEGTFTATDRRVLRVRKALEPPGSSKPDWEIVCELARHLGSKGFAYSSSQEILAEMAGLTPIYGGIFYERLDRGEILAWPCPSRDHPGTKFLHAGTFSRGKGRFSAIDHREPPEAPDAAYPFVLTTGRIIFQYHTGTLTRRIPALDREAPKAVVEINPQDAKRLGIGQGQRVTVESRRGAIQVDALVTERVAPGVVFMSFHFAEAAANVLTTREVDPEAKIPELKVCAVRIQSEARR